MILLSILLLFLLLYVLSFIINDRFPGILIQNMTFNLRNAMNKEFPVSHRLRDAMGNRTDSSERVFAFEAPTYNNPGYDFRNFNYFSPYF
jgi:hypothetical protein